MPKNNTLINQYRHLAHQVQNITQSVYAGIALTLHRQYGWGHKRINDLFAGSQEIWNECVQRGIDMIEMCAEETGIECRAAVNER